MHLCVLRAIEHQFARSLHMNRSPHLQAVLALGLQAPAWSANGSLALQLITEQPVQQCRFVALAGRKKTKWKYVDEHCVSTGLQ